MKRTKPELSAAIAPRWWHGVAILVGMALLVGLLVVRGASDFTREALAFYALEAVVSLVFLAVWLLRGSALALALTRTHEQPPILSATTTEQRLRRSLPRYSVIVPMLKEDEVLPDLIAAMQKIDYPVDRIEILLALEETDRTTQAALAQLKLGRHFKTVIVPDCQPKTKPKALNYALTFATGTFCVIYDAEDTPEPDQLLRALEMFERDPTLGCVQASLAIHNAHETWFTRQFAIEYTVLFSCLLPALEKLGIPLPLSGTSNHFRVDVLREVGGWDPYNVTEDADLGFRLARAGRPARTLRSTTWEEAPADWQLWLGQRIRWMKGWLQTYIVHMHRPLTTLRDLGFMKFAGLQILMAGLLFSALVHPWAYVLGAVYVLMPPDVEASAPWSDTLFMLAAVNLVMGYAVSIALGLVAVVRSNNAALAPMVLFMPVYWLLISWAAYRAIFQFIVRPFHWNKTTHRRRAAIPTIENNASQTI